MIPPPGSGSSWNSMTLGKQRNDYRALIGSVGHTSAIRKPLNDFSITSWIPVSESGKWLGISNFTDLKLKTLK